MITDGKVSPIKPIITIGFVPFTNSYSIMVIFGSELPNLNSGLTWMIAGVSQVTNFTYNTVL